MSPGHYFRMLQYTILFLLSVVSCLKDVIIDIPHAVNPGDTVVLMCTYDLEGDDLYSVKWYKGSKEFFRYVPKELPHIKVFPMLGTNVDISQSGPEKVVLRDVHWNLTGKYRCEVSTDAPYFHTMVVAAHMHVVDAPVGKPSLSLEKLHYGLGDTVRGNCSSPPSKPAANITWFVNDKPVRAISEETMSTSVSTGLTIADETEHPKFIKTTSIAFQVSSFHLGKLKINCTADLYNVFTVSNEIVLEEEKPKIASIMGNSNFEKSSGNRITGNVVYQIIFSFVFLYITSSSSSSR